MFIRCGCLEGSGVTKVIIEPDESFESALKRFKKQCEKAGLLSEFKKRQHYEKPSVRRKRKALAARKKAKRRERMADLQRTHSGRDRPHFRPARAGASEAKGGGRATLGARG